MSKNTIASSGVSRLKLFREAYLALVCFLFAPTACGCPCNK
nr:hypothetical protein [uncultured Cohaesibacter sp.]